MMGKELYFSARRIPDSCYFYSTQATLGHCTAAGKEELPQSILSRTLQFHTRLLSATSTQTMQGRVNFTWFSLFVGLNS